MLLSVVFQLVGLCATIIKCEFEASGYSAKIQKLKILFCEAVG